MLPAQAGMIPGSCGHQAAPGRAPRSGGDDPHRKKPQPPTSSVLPAQAGMIRGSLCQLWAIVSCSPLRRG